MMVIAALLGSTMVVQAGRMCVNCYGGVFRAGLCDTKCEHCAEDDVSEYIKEGGDLDTYGEFVGVKLLSKPTLRLLRYILVSIYIRGSVRPST